MEKTLKFGYVAFWGALASFLGNLYIPVMLMVLCNLIDYLTGLMAVSSRDEKLSSYRSMKGIAKKVCMWLLVVVGVILDEVAKYAADSIGLKPHFQFFVACLVAIWIICSELISILENMVDIGVTIPPFLMSLVKQVQKQTEEAAGGDKNDQNNG